MQNRGAGYQGSLPEGFGAVWFKTIDSTNDEAKRRAGEGAFSDAKPNTWPNTWYVAGQQTVGRGRRGREWVSEPGNLYASLYLKPDCTVAEGAVLSFVAALAVADTLAEFASDTADITLKWPNDVLFNGKKISGILLESSTGTLGRLNWLVIGVGINLAHFPRQTAYPATSLQAEGVDASNIEAVFEHLATHMADWLSRWRDEGFLSIRSAWMARAAFLGQRITISPDGEAREGKFCGLSDDGALMLKMDDGQTYEVPAGDVFPTENNRR